MLAVALLIISALLLSSPSLGEISSKTPTTERRAGDHEM
jgi:hypothetical protein